MATITSRIRKDGSISYLVQIRIRKKGIIIYQENKTFDQKKPAQKWARHRESYIDNEGIGSLLNQLTIAHACRKYIEEISTLPRGIGRSKKGALMYMQKQPPLASLDLVNHSSEQLMSWIKWRSNEGAAPATVAQDVIYLKQVFEYARSA
jgi:hypothetical protein